MTEAARTAQNADIPRDILLTVLKRNREKWVSGEELAKQLSMTRSAIWKNIGILREEGYEIKSLPRLGYRLVSIPDLLLSREIRDGLNTTVFGKRDIIRYVSTDSTNNRAMELAARGTPEGVMVIAEAQLRGRGRLERSWFSPEKENIYVSFIVRPSLSPTEASRMVLLAVVAAADALIAATGLTAYVKWPNDILVGGRKIASVLLEMAVEMDAIDYMVIGLGINVNCPAERFPADLREKATSVLIETGKPFSRVFLLNRFLEFFEKEYNALRANGFQPVVNRWKTLTNMIGRKATIRTISGSYEGVITNIDYEGFLILRDDEGSEKRLFSGDITII
ncbi:MAG: biotin--[acetyl-CoA-carboxylase] ligase [Smithella sp.]